MLVTVVIIMTMPHGFGQSQEITRITYPDSTDFILEICTYVAILTTNY